MGLFERLERIAKAEMNYNNLDDPEKALSKHIKEMEATVVKLRQSIAQTSYAQKKTQNSYNFHISEIARWEKRAELALSANDENLAREALLRKQYSQSNAASLKTQMELDRSTAIINNLQQKLIALEMKVAECKMLQTRLNATKAQRQLQETIGGIDTSSAMGAFDRMEDKVMQLEAESESAAELDGMCLEQQFAQLEASSGVDDELEAMKAQLVGGSVNQEALPAAEPSETKSEKSAIDAELEELRSQLKDS